MFKTFLFVVLAGLVIWLGQIWYIAFVPGHYWENAALFQTFFMSLVPLAILAGAFFAGKWIVRTDFKSMFFLIPLLVAMPLLHSCREKAKTNQLVVISHDCGATWKKLESGKAIPTGTGNYCFMKEIMPGYSLTGEAVFFVRFQDVKAKLGNYYAYEIFDALLFMKEAKQLGKTNAPADDPSYDAVRFEAAENRIIDIVIKEITSDSLKDIKYSRTDLNTLEEQMKEAINKKLAARGVRLVSYEMIPELGEQTEMALDAINALDVYRAAGIEEFGKQVILARASAPTINVNLQGGTTSAAQTAESEK